MSTYSMDGGDSFDPTVDIVHSEFFIQIFTIYYKFRFMGNTVEYVLKKSR